MVRVIAVNGSPRMNGGNTALILGPFLEGMKEEGADVELFYTKRLDIRPCQGEFNCWVKRPGECFQDDDMRMLIHKLCDADIIVLASPVYVDGITGPLKNFMDRMIPLLHPSFGLREGHCRHPLREGVKTGKLVLVSNCGFHEMDNFDPLIVHMRAACKNMHREFAGALLRPCGWSLRHAMNNGDLVEDIFEAAREAGRRIVADGELPDEALSIVSREIITLDECFRLHNTWASQVPGAPEKDA
ncbi:MAG: flavodoxin family protein [Thermoplasmata archaeon]